MTCAAEHNEPMIHRSAGEGRYARLEREQRWLLAAVPEGVTGPVTIVDRYLDSTRLRLRRMESAGVVVAKLGQKVRAAPHQPELVKLTNVYLSEEEYAVLARLPAAEIAKTRWSWTALGRRLAVDRFSGPLAGLVLAETELESDEPRLALPPEAVADVTDEDAFSGGALARTSAPGLERLLAERGVAPTPATSLDGAC